MKKGFFRNYNNTLTHLMPLYEKVDNLLKADFLLTWNDLVSPNKENVGLAKKHGKPSFIIEHGMKAVSDYEKGLSDTLLNMGGKPFIADHMMTWGDKSREIMIESGVPENKVTAVGSPIIHDYLYKYRSQSGEEKVVPFNAGLTVIDPMTKNEWELVDCTVELPQIDRDAAGNPDGNLIIFMPYHDWRMEGIKKTQEIWDKIKDYPNVLVAASSAYQNDLPENPFRDLLKIKDYNERIQRILTSDIRKPSNMDLVKGLFRRAKLVITTIPGTINGVAWAMDVPVLTPLIDWHWEREGKTVYDVWPADYQCDLEDIVPMMDSILKNDTKAKDRLKYAKYFMGIDKGNPVENMRRVIENEGS
jgi:hypothetical protein